MSCQNIKTTTIPSALITVLAHNPNMAMFIRQIIGFFKHGPFTASFWNFIIFPWFIVYITIYNYFLAMVIGNRKEEGRVCMSSIRRSLEKARRPARIEPVTKYEPEKSQVSPEI